MNLFPAGLYTIQHYSLFSIRENYIERIIFKKLVFLSQAERVFFSKSENQFRIEIEIRNNFTFIKSIAKRAERAAAWLD